MSPYRWLSSRFLDRWFVCGIAIAAVVLLGVQAYFGSRFSAIMLALVACAWIVMATLNGTSWKRTLDSWTRTLDDWRSSTEYTKAIENLLQETVHSLHTWDSEKAEEIAGRAQTIARLYMQNMIEGRQEVE